MSIKKNVCQMIYIRIKTRIGRRSLLNLYLIIGPTNDNLRPSAVYFVDTFLSIYNIFFRKRRFRAEFFHRFSSDGDSEILKFNIPTGCSCAPRPTTHVWQTAPHHPASLKPQINAVRPTKEAVSEKL